MAALRLCCAARDRRSRSRAPAPMRALRVLSTTPIMAVRGPVSPIPPDYGYWPDFGYWPYGLGTFDGGWRRGSRHGFAHATRRGRVFRLGRRIPGGFGDGFPHAGGL